MVHPDRLGLLSSLRDYVCHDSLFTWRPAIEQIINIELGPPMPWLKTLSTPASDEAPIPSKEITMPRGTEGLEHLRTLVQEHESLTWREALVMLIDLALDKGPDPTGPAPSVPEPSAPEPPQSA